MTRTTRHGTGLGFALHYKTSGTKLFTSLIRQPRWTQRIFNTGKPAADAEHKTGNNVSAAAAYKKASEIDPGNAQLWIDWSMSYFEQGDYEQAIELLEKGLNECPDNADMYYLGVVYFLSSGSYKSAINRLETALMLDFDGHEILFNFFPNLPTQRALYGFIKRFKEDNE